MVLVHDALVHSQAVWDDLVAPSACQAFGMFGSTGTSSGWSMRG